MSRMTQMIQKVSPNREMQLGLRRVRPVTKDGCVKRPRKTA